MGWVRRAAVLLGLAIAACDGAFDLEHVDYHPPADSGASIQPVQELLTSRTGTGGSAPLTYTFGVPATTAGHTLVVIAVIKTSTYPINMITDDGLNLWTKIIEGDDPNSNDDCHLEIWVSRGVNSATMINLMLDNDRGVGANFSEWDLPGRVSANVVGTFATTTTPAAGPLVVGEPALLLAAVAHRGGVAVVDDAAYTGMLNPQVDDISVSPWYQVVDASTYELKWMFGSAVPSIGAMVALATQP